MKTYYRTENKGNGVFECFMKNEDGELIASGLAMSPHKAWEVACYGVKILTGTFPSDFTENK